MIERYRRLVASLREQLDATNPAHAEVIAEVRDLIDEVVAYPRRRSREGKDSELWDNSRHCLSRRGAARPPPPPNGGARESGRRWLRGQDLNL